MRNHLNLITGSRVQAIKDSEEAFETFDGYFYRANDTGTVESTNEDGAWVKWDDSERSDGIWFAS